MNNNFGLTPQGFKLKRLYDLKAEIEELFISEFGEINLDPQSVAGQIIGILAKMSADDWENLEDVYFSGYPSTASGISLDFLVQLNGLSRLPAQATRVIGVATGAQNTLIPTGSLARQPISGEIFQTIAPYYITSSNSVQNIVRVTANNAQIYTVNISGVPYNFSLPTIGFSAPFGADNSIAIRVNGINLPIVNYTTDQATTLAAIRTALLTLPAIGIVNVVGNTLEIAPALGFQVVINSVQVSGTGTPTNTITYRLPFDTTQVAQFLSANINNAANVNSSYVSGDTFTITAEDSEFPYSLNVGNNLQITQTSSPVIFFAQNSGPIAAPAGTLTEIITGVPGWTSLTNFKAGVTGRNIETDAELRLRRANSLRFLGAATPEAIRARLLQDVVGVTAVTIFENITMFQSPIIATFDNNFVSGDVITVTINGRTLAPVNFATNQVTTMSNLTALLLAQPEIQNATYGGSGNRVLTIAMEPSQQVNIDYAVVNGVTVKTYTQTGGRPPKSFEAVVTGGSDADVALKIWQTKPAGIETFGNTLVNIIDSQGNSQPINFTRATPVYISVQVTLTLSDQEQIPPNVEELVTQAILDYGQSLSVGQNVLIQRIIAAAVQVKGVAMADVQIARTNNPNSIPAYGTSDIIIGAAEVPNFDISRIYVSV